MTNEKTGTGVALPSEPGEGHGDRPGDVVASLAGNLPDEEVEERFYRTEDDLLANPVEFPGEGVDLQREEGIGPEGSSDSPLLSTYKSIHHTKYVEDKFDDPRRGDLIDDPGLDRELVEGVTPPPVPTVPNDDGVTPPPAPPQVSSSQSPIKSIAALRAELTPEDLENAFGRLRSGGTPTEFGIVLNEIGAGNLARHWGKKFPAQVVNAWSEQRGSAPLSRDLFGRYVGAARNLEKHRPDLYAEALSAIVNGSAMPTLPAATSLRNLAKATRGLAREERSARIDAVTDPTRRGRSRTLKVFTSRYDVLPLHVRVPVRRLDRTIDELRELTDVVHALADEVLAGQLYGDELVDRLSVAEKHCRAFMDGVSDVRTRLANKTEPRALHAGAPPPVHSGRSTEVGMQPAPPAAPPTCVPFTLSDAVRTFRTITRRSD